MTGEIHPLLYTAMVGKYTCKVTNKTTSKERHFVVKGTKSVLSLHNYNNNYYTCMSVCCNNYYCNYSIFIIIIGSNGGADFSAFENTSGVSQGLVNTSHGHYFYACICFRFFFLLANVQRHFGRRL